MSRQHACNLRRLVCIVALGLGLRTAVAEKGPAGAVSIEQRRSEQTRRWAVLIGVNKYEDEQGIGSLKYCVADVELIMRGTGRT